VLKNIKIINKKMIYITRLPDLTQEVLEEIYTQQDLN